MRFVNLALRIIGLLVALAVAVPIVVIAILQFPAGRTLVSNMVSDLASSPSQTISVEDLYLGFDLDVSAKRIALGDDLGTWLEADDLSVSWSPLQLISGTLQVNDISASRVDLNRLPAASEETQPAKSADETGSSFALPLDVALGSLGISEINLGEPLLGTPIALALTGSGGAAMDPAIFSVNLDVRRIDGVDARLSAKAEFAPSEETLAFDIKVSGPRGGLAARLLDVPDLPALGLELTGSGPLNEWAADLSIALDGRQTVSGTAKLAETAAARHLTFDLDGDLAPLAPPEAHAFLLGTTNATGKADFTLDFAPQSGAINLKTQTVSLSAQGALENNRLSADADLAVSAGGDSLIALDLGDRRIAFGPLTVKLSAIGDMSSVAWSTDIGLASFETTEIRSGQIQLAAKGSGANFTPDVLTTPFDLSLTADGLQGLMTEIQFVTGALALNSNGSINGASQTLNLSALALTSSFVNLNLSDTELGAEKASGNGRLTLSDLSRFSQLAGQDLGGAVTASVDFDLDPSALEGTANLQAVAQDIRTGTAQADALLTGRTDMKGTIKLAGVDDVSVEDLTVTNTNLTLAGSADYESGALASDITVSLPDLALADPQLGGALDLSAETSGPLDRLDITADVKSKQILLAGTPLDNLELDIEATADPSAPSASVNGSADLNGQTVSVDVDLKSADGAAELNPLAVRVAENTISGDLAVADLENPVETLSGSLKIDAPNLAAISPLALTELGGRIEGTLTADPDAGKLLLDLSGSEIDVPSVNIGSLQLKADIARPYDPKTVSADLVVNDLITAATPVRSVALTAKPQGDGTALTADVKLEDGAQVGLTLAAVLSQPTATSYALALNQLALNYQGIASQLKQPATITYGDGTADITPLELALGQGSLSISGSAGEALGLQADLNAVPLSLANAFVSSLGIGGTLTGTVNAKGSTSAPEVDWALSGSGLTASPLRDNGLSALALNSNGTLINNQISQTTKVSDANGLSISAKGTVGLSSPQPLSITVDGTIPTAALRRPLLEAGIRAEGGISLNGSIGGSAQSPAYNLTAAPSGLKVTSLSTGLTVQNIRGSANVTQDQASLNGIAGDLATGGSLSASGTVGMKDGSPANLNLSLDKARYIDPGLVNAEVDASISVTGPLASTSASPLIGGTVTINKADVSIPESLPGAIPPVDVRHLNASAAVRRQAEELGGGDSGRQTEQRSNPPRLDVLVSAPGRIFIRGRGLDAELQGNLKIVGTTADPQAIGAFTLRRGVLDILTRRLTFSTGRATFEGSLTPFLEFVATTTVSDTTITITVTGEADDPQIAFTSSPELPQDEVLALLLFGKSVGNLSATQIAQLGAAVATLTGGSDSGPLAQIRKSLGLDAIDIDTSGEDGPSVSVGRYINDNIYLGVEQGASSGSSRVKVDIDLDRGLKVRGEVGADGSSKAGIFFEREY
jgi:translocation and assembly module TamB